MAETATAGKVNTAKLIRLLGLQKELVEKFAALNQEIDDLLGGGAGTAAALKALEITFDGAWCERYAPGQTGRYVWTHTRDKPQLKRLLKAIGLEELGRRMWNYLRNDDPFFTRGRHNFGTFVSTINQHAGEAAAPPDLELSARPIGCDHTPPCSSDQVHTREKLRELRH